MTSAIRYLNKVMSSGYEQFKKEPVSTILKVSVVALAVFAVCSFTAARMDQMEAEGCFSGRTCFPTSMPF